MCGIVGYIGNKSAAPVLIEGLTKLEYRGYDSAGVAILNDAEISICKCKGRLANLENKLENENYHGTLGIGHTRWATHGAPNDTNSHPHLSSSGRFAVVHNGIVENYLKLKEMLQAKGIVFKSDTDTEVIAHLIEYYYRGDLVHAVNSTIEVLQGTYALGVICKDSPDRFIAARKESPLVIGLGEGENYIASDIPAILNHTKRIIILEDNELAVITKNKVQVMDAIGNEVKKDVMEVQWDVAAAEKGGYEHFMMKEMYEEPKTVKDTVSSSIIDGKLSLANVTLTAEDVNKFDRIFIVACGTAYHAGVVAKYQIEKFAKIPVEVDVASEFRYRNPLVSDKNLVIIISQSGETLDTLVALKECKKRGARILSIVNVVGSSIARESHDVLYTLAGPEIAVASTKAYNTQLAALYLVTAFLAQAKGEMDCDKIDEFLGKLLNANVAIEKVLESKDNIAKIASNHYNSKSIFFIGRGLDYALSMEGSLKLKEISYVHSEAYAGGELKHGTIALIEKGTLVVCPITQDELIDKMKSNIEEVRTRGAVVVAITQQKHAADVATVADEVIVIPDVASDIAPIVAVTPLQLFAYYMAVEKGCDVDKPRNLAKSVTVE